MNIKRLRMKTTALLIALCVTPVGIAVLDASPAAAATCSGSSCQGHDPHVYGCSITSTKSATYTSGSATVTLYNEYSAGCNANWAGATENAAAQSDGWQIQVAIYDMQSKTSSTAISEACFPGPDNTGATWETCSGAYYKGASGWPAWTDMVNGTDYTWALLSVFNSSGTFLHQLQANQ